LCVDAVLHPVGNGLTIRVVNKYDLSLGLAMAAVLVLSVGSASRPVLPARADFESGRGFSPAGIAGGWESAEMHSLKEEIQVVDITAQMAAEQDGLGIRSASTFDPTVSGSSPSAGDNREVDAAALKRMQKIQAKMEGFSSGQNTVSPSLLGERDSHAERSGLAEEGGGSESREREWSFAREREPTEIGDVRQETITRQRLDDALSPGTLPGSGERATPSVKDNSGFGDGFGAGFSP
jgi:hypothetical protein